MKKLLIIVVLMAVSALGASAQSSEFTYQGRLLDSGLPPSANYDLEFRLFDSVAGGTQVGGLFTACNSVIVNGPSAICDDVAVTNGIFTVRLDFGAQYFNGLQRFLQISARTGSSTGPYTPLAPRQPITSSPYSIKSASSTSADGLSIACFACVTDAHILSIDGGKVTGTVASATTANNVSGVVAIANGGTGSATKNFVDLSTNQTQILGNKTFAGQTTLGNAVIGSATINAAAFNNADPVTINGVLNVGGAVTAEQFSGSGESLVNVPGTFKWQTVAGLTQQAERNTGYVTTNGLQVTVTLPASPIIGDTVRISGTGAGGWRIAQNAGQSVIGTNIGLAGLNWTARESTRTWQSVASSTDGSKLVAVAYNGRIYTSIDFGVSWTPRESNREWKYVASSADGTKLVAAVINGQIYTSTDSGINWTPRESNRVWLCVASSADGIKLVAVAQGGQIYTSTDSGVTWTPRESNRFWNSVASSADGVKLVAVAQNDKIYTSTDSGVTWTPRENSRLWLSVASSADGIKLAAVPYGGQIYISTNSGVTWTPRESIQQWWSIASSADGSKLIAIVEEIFQGGWIYTSTDSGATWVVRETQRNWKPSAISPDGSLMVGAIEGGQLYVSTARTTVGAAGYLTGGQFAAIELQYIGNGVFLPLSHSGAISGF